MTTHNHADRPVAVPAADQRFAVHQIFERQAEANPEAIALVTENQTLTYRQLNERANQLAHYLRDRGVTRETLVGVCMRRSPETVIAFLAILKAGGAYVPLDPDYPRERLSFMIADTRAPVVVTDRSCAAAMTVIDATIVKIDEAAAEIDTSPRSNPGLATSPSDLIYVMYTSGSTGRPKGVLIEHRAVVRLVRGADYVSFDADQRFLLLAPISFDASTFEIWGPLLNGGSLAVAPPPTPSLDQIGDLICRMGVTTLWLTAGLFNLMVDQNLEGLRSLKQLIAGGDALSVAHCRRVLEKLPGCTLVNGYGPTETTTFAICMTIKHERLQGPSVPIGIPINQTQIYLLDRDLNPVAEGESGEIGIGGLGVARGYLNQPELTAEKFVAPAWGAANETRIYRTGDLGRRGVDGVIEYLGRLDEQVKISGYRIEPNEIACVLREHPQVRDAAVIAQKHEGGSATLTAYVVSSPLVGRDELKAFLASKLPPFMVPAHFIALDSIPLTNNGKVDRAALPKARIDVPTKPQAGRPPLNGKATLEDQIAAIWSSVLRCPEVDTKANFFELGGDSLRLIEVHSRLGKELGAKIPITDLFESPTIEAIAQRLANKAPAQLALSEIEERARRQREMLARRAR